MNLVNLRSLENIIFFSLLFFLPSSIFAQVNLDASVNGDTIYTCDTMFYDAGGSTGAMGSGTYEVTFCPSDSSDFMNVRFDFDESTNHMPYTNFYIYDGASTSATLVYNIYSQVYRNYGRQLLGTHWWANMSGSGDGSNCLTFKVQGTNRTGWEGHVFCSDSVDPPENDEICGATPINIGASLDGSTTYSTRSCFGTSTIGTAGGYNYGHYATHSSIAQNIGDVFYSFIAPNSGQVKIDLEHNPLYADDDFFSRIHILQKINCNANCATTSTSDYTSNYSYDFVENTTSCAATTANCYSIVVYYQNASYNNQLRITRTGLVPGREYILQIKGGYRIRTYNSISLNGNACGEVGVLNGAFNLKLTDGRPYVDGTSNCNALLAPANDVPCSAFELGIECNKTNGSNVGASVSPCSDVSYQKLTGSSSSSTNYSATAWYKYEPLTEEVGQSHSLTVRPTTCYTRQSTTCDYNGDSVNDNVYALVENSTPRILYSVIEVDTSSVCDESDIVGGNGIANAGTTGSSLTSPVTISFTPQAGKVYYLAVATNVSSTSGRFCDFEIEMDVYEDISVNGGLPSGYICEFPEAPEASVVFEAVGGRGSYIAYFVTDSTAIASWSGGDAESSTTRIDTINGQGFLTVSNISDGESWSVIFDDGLGCTYYEGATYDYDLWCNKCDGYTKLNIVQADTAACMGEEILLSPKVDASVPEPYYAGGSFSRSFDKEYTSGAYSAFYNNDGTNTVLPNPEMAITETTIAAGSAQVEEICIKLYSNYWNYATIDLELDGCGSTVNIWKGNKVGGSDYAPSYYGRGYQTFCITTGWKNDTYGVDVGSGPIGTSTFNTAWSGCDPQLPIKITSSGGWAYRYVYFYNMTTKILDYRDAPIASYGDGYSLGWIPETTSNTPFSPSISDGSELSYTPFSDPDSLTATFVETVPGTYAYHLVGTDANGCEVGQGINHGGPDGTGRFEIQVYNHPVIDGVEFENTLCFGGKTDVTASITVGDNTFDNTFGYKWSITGTTGAAQGFLIKENTSTTTILTTGTGTITFDLVVTDSRGCSDSYSDTITINPDCPADAGQY